MHRFIRSLGHVFNVLWLIILIAYWGGEAINQVLSNNWIGTAAVIGLIVTILMAALSALYYAMNTKD